MVIPYLPKNGSDFCLRLDLVVMLATGLAEACSKNHGCRVLLEWDKYLTSSTVGRFTRLESV